jgi:adenylate kinase
LQYGVVHISAGDLLRAEIAAGTENGKQAKEFMEKGQLVPDEIVVNVSAIFFWGGGVPFMWIDVIGTDAEKQNLRVCQMVKDRLLQPDAQEKGWLLDGYPRSYSQAMALENLNIQPDIFILLDVSFQLDQIVDMC